MRIITQFASLFLCILVYSSCNTDYKADSLPTEQLHFGRSGGFTGSFVNYILVDSGQLFEDKKEEGRKELGRIPKGDAQALLARARELDWGSAIKPPPGNMNSNLTYYTADGYGYELSWSRMDIPQLEKFISLHQDLLNAFQVQATAKLEKEKEQQKE